MNIFYMYTTTAFGILIIKIWLKSGNDPRDYQVFPPHATPSRRGYLHVHLSSVSKVNKYRLNRTLIASEFTGDTTSM